MTSALKKIRLLDTGLGLRLELADKISDNREEIEVLEIVTEHFIGKPDRTMGFLSRFSKDFPVIPHGLDLSIGTSTALDKNYLTNIKTVLDIVKAP